MTILDRSVRAAVWVASAGLLAPLTGCDDPASRTSAPHDAGSDAGADGPLTCAGGEALVADRCIMAGVPSGDCGVGFVSDDGGGCAAVLPASRCGRGTMAVPGEGACRPVAPCGDAPWGEIPVDVFTQFVDGSYAGTDSDGSADRPWSTLQAAILAAEPGQRIAIAAGVYAESAFIGAKPLEIWGRCPELVEIGGVDQFEGLLLGASGTEVHTVAFTSQESFGLLIGPGEDILVDRVWIHDTGDYGVLVGGFLGPTDVTIVGSLIEGATGVGIATIAGRTTVESSTVRGGVADALVGPGRGIDLAADDETGERAELTLRGSLIEHNLESGVVVFGSDLIVERSVVRDTLPTATGKYGIGVAVQSHLAPSTATLTTSVVTRGRTVGVSALGAAVALDRCVVSDTEREQKGRVFGDAVAVIVSDFPAELTVAHSRIATSARAGVASFGSAVSIAGSAFDCNAIHLDGEVFAGPYAFEDLDGNACGCGDEAATCQVVTSGLSPPVTLP